MFGRVGTESKQLPCGDSVKTDQGIHQCLIPWVPSRKFSL
jgi:hypothetical protein